MAFNPDQYLSEKVGQAGQAPAFDPDLYLSQKDSPIVSDAQGKAALEHFGNAASLGYLPQIQAVTEPAMSFLLDKINGTDVYTNTPGYMKRRDENVARLKQESADFPKTAIAADVAGALASGGAISGKAAIQGATAAGRILGAAGTGAALGAAANPGDVEGEVSPFQLGDRAKNAATGAIVGGVIQGGAEAGSKLVSTLADKGSHFAERRAFKALGPYQRDVLQNSDKIEDIGRTVLDEGVIGKRPVGYETLSERAGSAKAAAGQELEKVVDEIASQPGVPSVSRKDIADSLRQELLGNPKIPGVAKKNAMFGALIDEFENGQVGDIPLKEARSLKQDVGSLIKWDRLPHADIPDEEQFYRAFYNQLKNGEEKIAEDLAKSGAIPNGSALLDAKSTYGNLAKAEAISGKRADKSFANQMLGLGDVAAGGHGATAGAIIGRASAGHMGAKIGAAAGGAAGALGSKAGHVYGNQVLAVGADRLSSVLGKSAKLQEVISSNPAVVPALLEALGSLDIAGQPRGSPQAPVYGPEQLGQQGSSDRAPSSVPENAMQRRLQNRR